MLEQRWHGPSLVTNHVYSEENIDELQHQVDELKEHLNKLETLTFERKLADKLEHPEARCSRL